MSPRRQHFSRGSSRDQRRLTAWDEGPGFTDPSSSQSFTTSTTAILGAGVTPTVDRFTIVRMHGILEVVLLAAVAATDGMAFAAGVGVVSGDAFAAGVGSLPNPHDDLGWPGWMWHHLGSIHTGTAGGFGATPRDNLLIPIESKSMRIIRQNEILFLAVQTFETGTATVLFRGFTRVLVKLS